MANLGAPIAAVIIVTALLVTFAIIFIIYYNTIQLIVTDIQYLYRLTYSCNYKLVLDNYTILNNHIIANITNEGCSILAEDFPYTNIIVYYMNQNGATRVELTKFNISGGVDTWFPIKAFNDIIFKINVTELYGSWDPGETLEINITVRESIAKMLYLVVILPKGQVIYLYK